jgi:hypothetical protein
MPLELTTADRFEIRRTAEGRRRLSLDAALECLCEAIEAAAVEPAPDCGLGLVFDRSVRAEWIERAIGNVDKAMRADEM